MKLHVVKCNPTGNMTILVMDPVPAELRTGIARQLLAEKHLHAEQVGFVEKPHDPQNGSLVRLQMMGGEFCANATRSLAAVLAFKGYPGRRVEAAGFHFSLEVSGVEHPVDCRVLPKAGRESVFVAEACLPLPLAWEQIVLVNEGAPVQGTLVEFPGISHLVVDSRQIDRPEAFFQHVRQQLSGRLEDAFGIMFHDNSRSYIDPLVWVKATDTLYWEKGCGSGTAAVGVVLAAEKQGHVRQAVFQPGGELEVSVTWRETVTALSLSGEIELVAEGTAYLQPLNEW